MMRIEDVILKSLVAVAPQIASATRSYCSHPSQPSKVTTPCCFELFGYDILIDDTLRPWLMEVNLSPSLACDSPLDWKVKSHMMCDLLTLVGVVCRDPAPAPARKDGAGGRTTAGATFSGSNAGGGAGGGRSSRAQDMSSRALLRRRTQGNTLRGRPASASSSNERANGASSQGVCNAFTRYDAQLVRRSHEEHHRRGGWIRIFPTEDSWALYSALFAQPISLYNLVLHQRLFPQTHKGHNSSLIAASAAQQSDQSTSSSTGAQSHAPTASSAALSVSAKRLPLHSSSAFQNILSTGTNDLVLANAYVNGARRSAQYEGRLGEPRARLSADEVTKIWRSLMPEVSRKCHTFGELASRSVWKARCIREYSDAEAPARPSKSSTSNPASNNANSNSNASNSSTSSTMPTAPTTTTSASAAVPARSVVEQVPPRDRVRRSYTSSDIPGPRPPYAPQSQRATVANDPRRIHLNVLQHTNSSAESGRQTTTAQASVSVVASSSKANETTTPKKSPQLQNQSSKAETTGSRAAAAGAEKDPNAFAAHATPASTVTAPPLAKPPAAAAQRPAQREREGGEERSRDAPNMQELASKLSILEARAAFTRYLRAIQRRFLAAEGADASVSSFRCELLMVHLDHFWQRLFHLYSTRTVVQ